MIKITDNARTMLCRRGAGSGAYLRVVVRTGGCAGMTYDAEIVPAMADDDRVVQTEDEFTVITNDESLPYLYGLTIDFSDDLISAGFRFNNSISDSSCGCGASFSLTGFPTGSEAGCGH